MLELSIDVARVSTSANACCLDSAVQQCIELASIDVAGMGKLHVGGSSDCDLDEPETIAMWEAAKLLGFGLRMGRRTTTKELKVDVPRPEGVFAVDKLDVITSSEAGVPNVLEERPQRVLVKALVWLESERRLCNKVVVLLVDGFSVELVFSLAKVVPVLDELEVGTKSDVLKVWLRCRMRLKLLLKLCLEAVPVVRRAEPDAFDLDGHGTILSRLRIMAGRLAELDVEAEIIGKVWLEGKGLDGDHYCECLVYAVEGRGPTVLEGDNGWSSVVALKEEASDDSKERAATSDGPQQVWMLLFGYSDHGCISKDEVSFEDAVGGEAPLSGHGTKAATKTETTDTDCCTSAGGHGAVSISLVPETLYHVAETSTRTDLDGAVLRMRCDSVESSEVKDDGAVHTTTAETCERVTTTSCSNRSVRVFRGAQHGFLDVCRVVRICDECRIVVEDDVVGSRRLKVEISSADIGSNHLDACSYETVLQRCPSKDSRLQDRFIGVSNVCGCDELKQ